MKCLVLVMCCNQDFFLREEKKVRDTWAKDILSNIYEDIDYFMYTASNNDTSYIDYENRIIYISCDDSLHGTFEKTSKCFELLEKEHILEKYDFIFRTNTSTYVNVSLLNEFLHSELIDNNLIYGGNVYCAKSACGPYNYSYYACGNSLLMPTKYLKLIRKNILDKYIKEYYNVVPNRKDVLNIDDNAIGFIINCFLEYKKNIYHKQIYRVYGNNYEDVSKINQYITTPLRIYNGNREDEFKLYNVLHTMYNKSTDVTNIYKIIKHSNNHFRVVTF